MAYAPPAPADLAARYPEFAATDENVIDIWLTEAALECASWPEDVRPRAEMAYAAYRMKELQIGAASAIPAGLTSFKSADFSATVSEATVSRTGYASNVYGREFQLLLRRYFGGPYLVGGGCV